MKTFFSILLFLLCGLRIAAQTDTVRPLRTVKAQAVDFALDNLGNLYLLTATDQLKKYNANGDSVAVYNDVKRFGKLFSLDVSNPLKLLLFYKDFSTVAVLDRFLALRTSLDLRRHNVLQATAVGTSYDNNIWVFDVVDGKLKKLDEAGNLLLETADFRMLFAEPVMPEKIWDRDGFVYLYDPAAGVYVFDNYGAFKRKFRITKWTNVNLRDKFIIGTENGLVHVFNTATLMQKSYKLPPAFSSQPFIVTPTQLFTLSKDAISIYPFRLEY